MDENGRPIRSGKVATRGGRGGGRGDKRDDKPPPGVVKGQKYQGVVKSLMSFGAFIELKLEDGTEGVQGMLHVSEMSDSGGAFARRSRDVMALSPSFKRRDG